MILDLVRSYIETEFLAGQAPKTLPIDRSLISTGIIDSVGTMRLVLWLEQNFAVEIATADIWGGKLETVGAMADLIEEQQRARAKAGRD